MRVECFPPAQVAKVAALQRTSTRGTEGTTSKWPLCGRPGWGGGGGRGQLVAEWPPRIYWSARALQAHMEAWRQEWCPDTWRFPMHATPRILIVASP